MTQATTTTCARAGCANPGLAACGRCGRVFCGEHVQIRQGVRGMVNLCDGCRVYGFSRYFVYVVAVAALIGVPGALGYLGIGTPGAVCGSLLGGVMAVIVAWRIMPE